MYNLLVLYYSRGNSVKQMAELIARGIESIDECHAKLRTVAPLADGTTPSSDPSAPPHVSHTDLTACDGLALGSPTRFGNMAAALKHFIDTTSDIWISGGLTGKPAVVFTSAASMHGGHESTLLSMMLPLLHHGMLIMGIPYQIPELISTQSGGTPYGASHLAGANDDYLITVEEKALCLALGKRLANTAQKLSNR